MMANPEDTNGEKNDDLPVLAGEILGPSPMLELLSRELEKVGFCRRHVDIHRLITQIMMEHPTHGFIFLTEHQDRTLIIRTLHPKMNDETLRSFFRSSSFEIGNTLDHEGESHYIIPKRRSN